MQQYAGYVSPPTRIRRMGLQDLGFVVNEHARCFPHGFFARLGPRFLARYYRTFLDGPLSLAIVTEINGAPVGYLVGILDTREHRRLLLRHHGVALAWTALLAMAVRPWLVAIFIWTRLRRYLTSISKTRPNSGVADASVQSVAVLSHVVVSNDARCRGVGASMVSKFVAEAQAAKCAGICLVTLAGARGAGTFYERRGWKHTHRRRSGEGRVLDYYRYDLPT